MMQHFYDTTFFYDTKAKNSKPLRGVSKGAEMKEDLFQSRKESTRNSTPNIIKKGIMNINIA